VPGGRGTADAAVELALHPGLPQQPSQSTTSPTQNEKVYLVEYGAGFFVERTAKESTDFYNRKINLIKERLGKLQEIIQEKREGLRAIEVRMLTLIQQQQQQQQQQVRK
jgi:prefoldin subunit 5